MNSVSLFISLLALLCSPSAIAEQARIAVAGNFAKPMQAITIAFEQATGHSLQVSSGSSGKLFAQIYNGAPFDVMLSADTAKPAQLIAEGLAVAGSDFTYARGRLVLWQPDNKDAKQQLEDGNFQRLAIANPRLAPYGQAAREVLDSLHLPGKQSLVIGENIAQAYQFVATGNADLGFVALSQVINNGQVPDGAWLVPASLHTSILQDAVLLQHGATNKAAQALMEFLRSDRAITIIRQYGYDVADTST